MLSEYSVHLLSCFRFYQESDERAHLEEVDKREATSEGYRQSSFHRQVTQTKPCIFSQSCLDVAFLIFISCCKFAIDIYSMFGGLSLKVCQIFETSLSPTSR